MATGKVRIFELAKELNMSSKDMIALFGRLGLEAKNQLSVVDPKVADLLRVQLGKAAAAKAQAVKPASAPVATPPPAVSARPVAAAPEPASNAPPEPQRVSSPEATTQAVPVKPAPVAAPAARVADAPVAAEPKPAAVVPESAPVVSTLKPVPSVSSRKAAPAPTPPVAVETPVSSAPPPPAAPSSASGAAPSGASGPAPSSVGGAAAAASVPSRPTNGAATPPTNGAPQAAGAAPLPPRPLPPRPRPPQAPVDTANIPTLRPVPTGRSSVVPPRPVTPPAPANPNSAAPGPTNGIPGRPGVAPRPGTGMPGQNYGPRPGGQGNPPGAQQAAAPGAPPAGRRPMSNGPFRPLTPPGPRPFTPRPPGSAPAAPGAPGAGAPAPSSGGGGGRPGGRPGQRGFDNSKKDREKDLLLEKSRQRKRGSFDAAPAIPPVHLESIEIPDVLTVQELANSMILPAADIIKELFKMGTMATINQNISSDQAIAVAKKFGFNAIVKEAGDEVVVEQEEDKPELLTTRPPVVTVLGHVDHGKTSLLDRIRSASVAAGEAGGITQKIGAYTVDQHDRKITFIDTPGHEAFTAMRARGAKVTDVAILVVAADDGVMPQTREAISHIKAAGVPIVVAINKMDKEDAQPDRVKQQLTDEGLQPVEWGGTVEMVPVSARNGNGIDKLLETVLLEADLKELKANKNRRATGVVIESALDRGRGAVATVLVQNGTLRVGDVVVVGAAYGKIRALVDDKGKQVKKAGPSIPVEIMGLSDVPAAGDTLMVVSDERAAREAAAKRSTKRRDVRVAATSGPRVSLETFMQMPADGGSKTLNLVIKADGQGSVEALRSRVESLSNGEVGIRVILAGVGGITPNDVNLASASNAVLIGFNIRPDETVKRLAENEQVDLRFYQVIYDVENDLKKAMVGLLAPKFREIVLGRAEVREIFKVSKVGAIAGCYVQSGKITRNSKVRVLRDSAVVFDGEIESLRRFKDDVREVAENFECGIQVARFADLKPGDVIEAWTSELVAPELQPA
jgi:translation initiation factor IF-2